jgi:hypothetical protein
VRPVPAAVTQEKKMDRSREWYDSLVYSSMAINANMVAVFRKDEKDGSIESSRWKETSDADKRCLRAEESERELGQSSEQGLLLTRGPQLKTVGMRDTMKVYKSINNRGRTNREYANEKEVRSENTRKETRD